MSAKVSLPEDTKEASLKADEKKNTEEVVETPTPTPENVVTEQTKEESTEAPQPAASEDKPSVEVVSGTVTEEPTVEKTEEETLKQEAPEETKENDDPTEVKTPEAAEAVTESSKVNQRMSSRCSR